MNKAFNFSLENMSGFLIQYEQLIEDYEKLCTLITFHKHIFSSKIPYGYRDEFNLQKSILSYVDSSIRTLFYLKYSLNVDLKFSIFEHEILRGFRNHNQHVGYHPIQPIKSNQKIDYFIWPNLSTLPKIRQKFQDWCSQDTDHRTLFDIIFLHHSELLKCINPVIEIISGKIEFRKEYLFREIGGIHW